MLVARLSKLPGRWLKTLSRGSRAYTKFYVEASGAVVGIPLAEIALQAHCESNPAEDNDAWVWETCSADCSALLSDIYSSLDSRPRFFGLLST